MLDESDEVSRLVVCSLLWHVISLGLEDSFFSPVSLVLTIKPRLCPVSDPHVVIGSRTPCVPS
jgi:hypothetical protein